MTPALLSWTIAGVATAGVVTRPFKLPEATWAVAGAALIVALGLLPASLAWQAIAKGNDVYLFLTGMMLLSETGRRAGVFDWLAVLAVNHAKGSPRRLFLLVYLIGIVITTFMSNDAAAVVLTPAVFAVAKKARAPALPLLFICAFIANAASFVLPISNPANLVLYGKHTPPLREWLAHFALPSLLSILATYGMLRWTQRHHLVGDCARRLDPAPLSAGGRLALAGMVATALALLCVSALDMDLGLPTAALGALTAAAVLAHDRSSPWPVVKSISWGVLLLVAGLFVLVETLDHTGVIRTLTQYLVRWTQHDATTAGALAGAIAGFGANAINNLPAGLIASSALMQAHSPASVVDALVIGIDLGPNLSITGSLATILWLTEIRREGEEVSFLQFLKVGTMVMPPALALALGVRLLLG
jgi:arsenical pump membrane protein